MNIALSAIILIVLLLPGAVAIDSYYSSLIAKQARVAMPFNDMLFKGLILSFILHSCSICIIRNFLSYEIRFELLYEIVAGKDLRITDKEFTNAFLQFCFYNGFLIIIAWGLAKLFKRLVQFNNFDLNYFSLRSMNYWFIVFSARYLESADVKGKQSDTDLVFLDVLTKTNVIYSGFLIDFNYSKEKDELENLILDSTVKRNYVQNEEESKNYLNHTTGKPCRIPGDAFVIPMNTIVNININYIEIEEMKDQNNIPTIVE
jgi:hypothetical protein